MYFVLKRINLRVSAKVNIKFNIMSIQQEKVLFIKDMICTRCIKVVRQTLEDSGYLVLELTLGKAVISCYQNQNQFEFDSLRKALREDGFDLIKDKEVF